MNARVLIVEDHDLLAQSLRMALSADGFTVEVAADLASDSILQQAGRLCPGVVLLDLSLGPAFGSSVRLIAPLRELGANVVMVTGELDRARLGECVAEGAIGIVAKSEPFDRLVEAVKDASELGNLLSSGERDELLAEMRRQRTEAEKRLARFERLTSRERKVLLALCDGKSADAIASESYVSLATVRSQIHSLLQKLGVNSQIGAVAAARRAGWEPDDDA